ncbi:MAG TPA: hypothetical protein VHD32_06335 [Candidatus Didemnitutus sp.]|nr:hypothetical protein [Candidatus Didemnitutus sp.]
MRKFVLPLALTALLTPAFCADSRPVLVERVEDTGFIRVSSPSFAGLSARQKELAYWLTQAAIAIDPIFYDQLSRSGLRQKRLLEEILARPDQVNPEIRAKIATFAKLFWANRGNHNLITSRKFLPTFTAGELKEAALAAQSAGAFRTPYADLDALTTPQAVSDEVDALRAAFFDAGTDPMITAKNPENGKDVIQGSSNTFYLGVSVADLKNFTPHYALNSRLAKGTDGVLRELVYRAGTPDGKVPPGLYRTFLGRAIDYLERARNVAEPAQATVIDALIRFYETGEFSDLIKYDVAWVQNDARVDFANGFIEIYRDAVGAKGSSQSFVSVTDERMTRAMSSLAANAAYFEEKAPWLEIYKKKDFRAPVVKAVEILVETGDFEISTIGDNLPNENEVREKYGSKNFLFTTSSNALVAAQGNAPIEEFYDSPETIARQEKYGAEANDLLTALHEIVGHGSGKLNPKFASGTENELKEYFSTMEEARADLMGLWNIWDPKLKELGLISNQEEVAKAMYDQRLEQVVYQLRSLKRGNTIEEDHQRNRALIANYLIQHTGAAEIIHRDGKTYVHVKDYQQARAGVGELLAEIMRIKAEGDYAAIKSLIDRYGVHFDPAVRDEVVARFAKLNLPAYWAGLYPKLSASFKADGSLTSVSIADRFDPIQQHLEFAAMYDEGLAKK